MAAAGLLVRSQRIGYREAWDAQRALARARAAGTLPDVLWLLEHPPVYTVGRNGRREDLHLSDEALVGAMADAAALPDGRPGEDAMGLYAGGRKLGSVGIRVSGGVTTHGLALNRDPDLEWFRLMTACGAPDVEATSIAAEGGDPRRERVEADLAASLAARLGLRLEPSTLEDLLPLAA